MKKMRLQAIIVFLSLWILTNNACMAQTDSTKQRISRAFRISTHHLKPEECTTIETLATVVVTFDSSAHVEKVLLSETYKCLTRNKAVFVEFLSSELNGLNLGKEGFSNGYILFVVFVTKLWETKTTTPDTANVFAKMFDNLDEAQVSGKELKLWLPMTYNIYKPIR